MAFTGVRLMQAWEADVKNMLPFVRPDYSDISKLTYLIHPGNANDCDFNEVAKAGISRELDGAVRQNQRVILVYPTHGGVYVDTTKVTDIRGGNEEEKWIKEEDVTGIKQATFVGGKLNKCLGYSYDTFIKAASRNGIKKIKVRLPLGGIYTEEGYTADQEFLAGASEVGEVQSLCALLAGINDSTYYYSKSDFEYGFLDATGSLTTRLYHNGHHVATFAEKKDLSPLEGHVSSSLYGNTNPLQVNLIVESSLNAYFNEFLARKALNRWNKIKTNVFSIH